MITIVFKRSYLLYVKYLSVRWNTQKSSILREEVILRNEFHRHPVLWWYRIRLTRYKEFMEFRSVQLLLHGILFIPIDIAGIVIRGLFSAERSLILRTRRLPSKKHERSRGQTFLCFRSSSLVPFWFWSQINRRVYRHEREKCSREQTGSSTFFKFCVVEY